MYEKYENEYMKQMLKKYQSFTSDDEPFHEFWYKPDKHTGVYFEDFSVSSTIYNIVGVEEGNTYVINTNEGYVARFPHAGLTIGPSLLPFSFQFFQGQIYGDMTNPESMRGFAVQVEAAGFVGGAHSWSVGKNGIGDIQQTGRMLQTNCSAIITFSGYWMPEPAVYVP